MTSSLVGSEMCIRDSVPALVGLLDSGTPVAMEKAAGAPKNLSVNADTVSYTHLTLPTICSV
eukprot:8955961-Prorocentrum_lima.AAC.1